jgi:hypothetical protein
LEGSEFVAVYALVNVIEPIWERRFIADTYANRLGKGTHRALDRCQQFARRRPAHRDRKTPGRLAENRLKSTREAYFRYSSFLPHPS